MRETADGALQFLTRVVIVLSPGASAPLIFVVNGPPFGEIVVPRISVVLVPALFATMSEASRIGAGLVAAPTSGN